MYTLKCTLNVHIIHNYTHYYTRCPLPRRGGGRVSRGERRGGGWCVPRPHICSTHQRCIQAYITIITILFSSISHRIALYDPIRTPIAIAATTFEMETTQSRWVTLHWFWFAADQPKVWHQRSLNYCVASNYFHCIDMHCMRGHCLKREPQLLHCIELFLLHCNALHARAIGVEASNGGGEVGNAMGEERRRCLEHSNSGFSHRRRNVPSMRNTQCVLHIYTHTYRYTQVYTQCVLHLYTQIHTQIHRYTYLQIHLHIYLSHLSVYVLFSWFLWKSIWSSSWWWWWSKW